MSRFNFSKRILMLIMLVYSIAIYEIFQSPILRLEGLLGIFAFSELSVVAYTPSYIKNFRELFQRKQLKEVFAPGEISDLVGKSKMKKIHLKTIPNYFGAYSYRNNICLGEELLKDFDSGMILAVITHELAHIRGRHATIAVSLMYVISAFLYLIVTGPPVIFAVAMFSTVTLLLIPLNWYFELSADDYATKLVGEEETKAVLSALGEKLGYDSNSETHPSVRRRLSRIERRGRNTKPQ